MTAAETYKILIIRSWFGRPSETVDVMTDEGHKDLVFDSIAEAEAAIAEEESIPYSLCNNESGRPEYAIVLNNFVGAWGEDAARARASNLRAGDKG